MRARPPQLVKSRAIISMVALYALLLQSFLAFAAPVMLSDPGGTVLCAEHGPGTPVPDQADAQCHACCMAIDIGTIAPPNILALSVPYPFPQVSRVAWRPEADLAKTGPPTHARSARGPPVA